LFINLPIDLHDLTGGFTAAGEESAENHGIAEGERFHDVAALGDTAVRDDFHVAVLRAVGGDVEGRELRDADPGDDAGGADGAGALPDFDGTGTAVGEVFDAGGAGDVAGDDGEVGESAADEFDHFADPGAVAVGDGDGHTVDGFVHKLSDVIDDVVAIEGAVGTAHGRKGGAHDEAEFRIAGGAAAGGGFGGDALDIRKRGEAAEVIFAVDHEHLVNAHVLGKEGVGGLDGIGFEGGFGDGMDSRAGRHGLGDRFAAIAFPDGATGKETNEYSMPIDDGEGAKIVALGFDHIENVADFLFGGDGDRILNEAVDVAFDAGDLFDLLAGGHVVVDEPESAVESHGDGHARLGDGVHVGRQHGNGEADLFRQDGGSVGVFGQDFRVERGERDVVEREPDGAICGKKCVGRLIKFGVERGGGGECNLSHELPGT